MPNRECLCVLDPAGLPRRRRLEATLLEVALAQYLPETSATIIKFNVRDWSYEKLFCVQDHVGLVVPNPLEGELLLGTWGSRHYYRTDLKGNIKRKHTNPCCDGMEHQDAQLISGGLDNLKNIRPRQTRLRLDRT